MTSVAFHSVFAASEPALSAAERGVFYESNRPAKNALEKKWIDQTLEKLGNPSDLELLQKTLIERSSP